MHPTDYANKKTQNEIEVDERYKSLQEAINQIKEDAARKKKKVPKKIEIVSAFLKEWNLYRSIEGLDSPVRKIQDPKIRKFAIDKLTDESKNKSKEELTFELANLKLDFLAAKELMIHYHDSYSRVLDHLTTLHDQILNGHKSRKLKKNEIHEEDNKRLMECLQELNAKSSTGLVDGDLLKFIRLVKRKYPCQLYIQQPRLTKEEKSLSKEEQAFILEDKIKMRGTEWSDSRLIDFFNSKTGLKGTTKLK
jgi:hypothetical protein